MVEKKEMKEREHRAKTAAERKSEAERQAVQEDYVEPSVAEEVNPHKWATNMTRAEWVERKNIGLPTGLLGRRRRGSHY